MEKWRQLEEERKEERARREACRIVPLQARAVETRRALKVRKLEHRAAAVRRRCLDEVLYAPSSFMVSFR